MSLVALLSILNILASTASPGSEASEVTANRHRSQALEYRFGTRVVGPEQTADLRLRFPNTLATLKQADEADLRELESALRHSEPSQLDKRGRTGIPVYFLATNKALGTLGDWELSENGKPSIFVEPAQAHERPLEEVLIHELAHNAEFRMGFDPANPGSWRIARQIGWHWAFNAQTGEGAWMLRSAENCQWWYSYDSLRGKWFRCNKNATPLDSDGEKVRRRCEAFFASNAEVRALAAVTPPSDYFTNPMEMFAEAIRLFRTSAATRRSLYACNPQLYELVRDQDQREIDKAFGKGLYIRTASGVLTKATSQSLSALQSFEKDAHALAAADQAYR